MKIRHNTFNNPKLLILSTSLMLAACGGGLPGAPSVPSGPPTGSTPVPKPLQTEMRLHADFTILEQSFLHAKPLQKGNYNRDQTMTGTLDQAVYIDGFSANDTSAFHAIPNKAMTVNATITEADNGHSEHPGDSTVVQYDSHSAFAGPISNPIDISIKRSALGVGDELSLRLEAKLSGKGNQIFKSPNGQTTELAVPSDITSILELDTSSPGDPNTLRKYAKTLWILPTLGARPIDPLDQQMYDAILKAPTVVHLGMITSPARRLWTYSGKLFYANTDTAIETTQLSETVAITICLKSVTDTSTKCVP